MSFILDSNGAATRLRFDRNYNPVHARQSPAAAVAFFVEAGFNPLCQCSNIALTLSKSIFQHKAFTGKLLGRQFICISRVSTVEHT